MRIAAPLRAAIALTAVSLLAAGCGGDSDAAAEDDQNILIWTSLDQAVMDGLEEAMKPKADAAGITVEWARVDNINQLIVTKVQANDTPDIALIPQPGVVGNLVDRDAVIPLDDALDMAALQASMIPGTLEAGTFDGQLYGLLVSSNVKSLVFYPKKAWDAAGYQAPNTLDELNALTEEIKGDGTAPWCIGIESGAATGWPATDWIEDLVMRYGGADGYNQWVSHEIPFNSDLVKQSHEYFATLAFTDGNVLGGRKSIASNNFSTAASPMFDDPPGCMLFKQGSFMTGLFPEKIQADIDNEVGVFGFPPATTDGESPVLGGGDLAALFIDTQSGRDVMKMLSEVDIGNVAAGNGSSFISPHTTFDATLYPNQLTADAAGVAYGSSVWLFDGSDQMPGEVGAGSFWKEETQWIADTQDLDTTLTNIDNSWP